jgi:4-alpha-glucanotransferase
MCGGNAGGPWLRDLSFRTSGILLHVTSLPSPHGIGDFGPTAISWIDRLCRAGQSWWQALPTGPTGYDDSPYQPLSSFAGNVLLISLDWLIEDGLLNATDCTHQPFPPTVVDYEAVTSFKHRLIETAWKRFEGGGCATLRAAYEQFRQEQKHWLDDYAIFRALKVKFGNVHYLRWPAELVNRSPTALARVRRGLADAIDQITFAQFLVFRQADRLKTYAHKKGLRLIGDLPFFVSGDSSDVWSSPELFLLDAQHRPRFVAGVPPDYFSARGQLWGNPVYDWDVLRQSGYRWWIARLRSLLNHVDVVRLDHFRGFAAAWHVPAGAATAENGSWRPGPGAGFFEAVYKKLGRLPFIAEDLGIITADVQALRDQFHLPGMCVLQFAFDGKADNPYLPENFGRDMVVYTGTHDNPPTRAWFGDLPADQQQRVRDYLKQRVLGSSEAAHALMEVAWSSKAELAVAPLQDLLDLGKEARMNVPGRAKGNWRWRCTEGMLAEDDFEWLEHLTKNAHRFESPDSREHENAEAISVRGFVNSEHFRMRG